ncbi:MAG: methionine--tRNA ligase [Deltaproteobacteria bacterium]|nr:MAG: methionine--tRNA ligase [Deltaproteobacteria bacterium]
MSNERSTYLTTPIYYVNGLPHIGHGYTTIAADVFARWRRSQGDPVFFLTGTDEHGQKVLQTAQGRGMTAQEHVDDLVVHWRAMWDKLHIDFDRFIRTTESDHERVVQAVLQHLYDRGLIEQKDYEGWYHVNDEIFVTDKDVEAGRYQAEDLQRITESNYWFKMSAYQDALLDHLERHPDYIQPTSRRNEVLGFLRQPLGDLCISRPKARMSWGIELPFDPDYVCYVWFDALLNYLSGIGYHPDPEQAGDWQRWWPATYQLIGKDILTTHAVYWSTMLIALDVPLPTTLYAHGWWTSADGDKMSKSSGNAIDLGLLVQEFGADVCRYFFLREKSFGGDGSFSYEGFLNRYNADLANDLGNLAHRGLSMTRSWLGAKVPAPGANTDLEDALRSTAARAVREYADKLDHLDFPGALTALWDLVKATNKYVDTTAPWALNKAGNTERLHAVLRAVLEVCHLVACCLLPVMPTKAVELLSKFGTPEQDGYRCLSGLVERAREDQISLADLHPGQAVDLGDPLFPRLKELPEAIAALFVEPEPEPSASAAAPLPPQIAFEDFTKIALRAGKVVSAKAHPKADRLLVLEVDIGEPKPRTIVAGIASRYAPEQLIGLGVVVVANLKPAKLRGIVSEGMLLAAGAEQPVGLVQVDAIPGEIVR